MVIDVRAAVQCPSAITGHTQRMDYRTVCGKTEQIRVSCLPREVGQRLQRSGIGRSAAALSWSAAVPLFALRTQRCRRAYGVLDSETADETQDSSVAPS